VGDDAHAALVGLVDERAEVLDAAVVRVDRVVVRDDVAAVAERRCVHRQQPDAVDPEPLEVVELLRQPAEVAGSVVVPVEEAADVDLVEDGPLEPQRVGLEPLAGLAHRMGPVEPRELGGWEGKVWLAPDWNSDETNEEIWREFWEEVEREPEG